MNVTEAEDKYDFAVEINSNNNSSSNSASSALTNSSLSQRQDKKRKFRDAKGKYYMRVPMEECKECKRIHEIAKIFERTLNERKNFPW